LADLAEPGLICLNYASTPIEKAERDLRLFTDKVMPMSGNILKDTEIDTSSREHFHGRLVPGIAS